MANTHHGRGQPPGKGIQDTRSKTEDKTYASEKIMSIASAEEWEMWTYGTQQGGKIERTAEQTIEIKNN